MKTGDDCGPSSFFARPSAACSRSRSPARRGADRPPAGRAPGLRAFLLRADETPKHEFNRTPSFAWLPVRGAHPLRVRARDEPVVQRELDRLVEHERRVRRADDDDHDDRGTADAATATGRRRPQDEEALREPADADGVHRPRAALDHRLALRALRTRPRDHERTAPTSWSTPFGFNMRWSSVPRDLDSPLPASSAGRRSRARRRTRSGSYGRQDDVHDDDERRRRARPLQVPAHEPVLHQLDPFRVRAQRKLYGEVVSGLPATSWGPWSPIVHRSPASALARDARRPVAAVSDVHVGRRAGSATRAHARASSSAATAAARWTTTAAHRSSSSASTSRRIEDCVNIVYTGAVVGSPA